jgi:hypothetical protein
MMATHSPRPMTRTSYRETDRLRLHDLAKEHGLKFRRVGSAYLFDDHTFTARNQGQALAFAEGFDRAAKR